jgi:hypothetical protein
MDINKRRKLSPILEYSQIPKLCLYCHDELYEKFGDHEYCYKCKYICSHCGDRVGWVDVKNYMCMICCGCNCFKCINFY